MNTTQPKRMADTFYCLELTTIQEMKDNWGVSKYMLTCIYEMYISKNKLQTFVHLETEYYKVPGYEYSILISKQPNYHKSNLNNNNPL